MVDEGVGHQPRHRHRAGHHVAQGLPRGLAGGSVDLEHPGRRGVRRHPAVEDDPDRVGVDEQAVARGPRQVRAVDVRGRTDRRVEPGLLVDLADHRGSRVLPVVDPAAGQGPQLGARDPRREPAQQELDLAVPLAEHDGVRTHALTSRQGSHGPQPSEVACARGSPVPRPVARQRQDGPGHAGRHRSRDRAGGGDAGQPLGLRLHLPVAHPGVRLRERLPLEVVRVGPPPDEEPRLHPRHPLPALRAGPVLLPPRGRRRGRDGAALDRAALDDVVPHRAADVAPDHPDPQAALALPAPVGDREPARRALGHRGPDDPPIPRAAAVLRARPAPQAAPRRAPRRRLGEARRGPDARRHRHHGRLHRHVVRHRPALVRHGLQRHPDRQRDRLPDAAHGDDGRPAGCVRGDVARAAPPARLVHHDGHGDDGGLPVPRLRDQDRHAPRLARLHRDPPVARAGAHDPRRRSR